MDRYMRWAKRTEEADRSVSELLKSHRSLSAHLSNQTCPAIRCCFGRTQDGSHMHIVSCCLLWDTQWHSLREWLDGVSMGLRDGTSIVVGLLVPPDLRPWPQIPFHRWLTITQQFLHPHTSSRHTAERMACACMMERQPTSSAKIPDYLKSIQFHLDTNSWVGSGGAEGFYGACAKDIDVYASACVCMCVCVR